MNILCIDCPYTKELEALGHKVLAPDFPAGVIYLPGILQMNAFEPDLVIQQERLGARLILGGLEKIKCPTVFVSVDSHLNMFWHKFYGRLFDVVLTAHLSFFMSLDKAERLPSVQRFATAGYKVPFRPFERRSHAVSFAGIITEHRPSRTSMLSLLEGAVDLHYPQGMLPHDEMLELFMDSCMLPNESIAREVNYRLFEGASCGALVFSQNIGDDQNIHFEPGLEFEPYEHSLELVEKIKFYRKHLKAAEKIGQAAWKRVQSSHLPEHRAAQLAELATCARRRAEGLEASCCFWQTLAQLARHGTHPMPVEWFLANMQGIEQQGPVAATKLRLLMEGSEPGNACFSAEHAASYRGQAVEGIRQLLESKKHADCLECNLAGAMASLALERPVWAAAFLERQLESLKKNSTTAFFVEEIPADDTYEHYLAWAKLLGSLGRQMQLGFNFRRGGGMLPASAFECLVLAKEKANPGQHSWLPEIHKVCSKVPGLSFWDMGFLAELSLMHPDKWVYQMQYGYSALENYRIEAGLFELEEARAKAREHGDSDAYNTMLEGLPSSSYILSALHKG